ncbi:hypothetical protein WUBG_12733 [Wuchereria bancrofti]|nr:hypothetical protein WUBG_12733 [Wuchereria bancrofti]
MGKTSECNSLLINRHNEKIIRSDINKSMDMLNAKTKNLLLNAGTRKTNRSESVDKTVKRSSGSWF